MRVAISMLMGCVVGYLLLVTHAHWLSSECMSPFVSPVGGLCTTAFALLPLVYVLPPLIVGAASRRMIAGVVTAMVVIVIGMEAQNVGHLFGARWYVQPHAFYLAILPSLIGGVVGAYVAQKWSIRAP